MSTTTTSGASTSSMMSGDVKHLLLLDQDEDNIFQYILNLDVNSLNQLYQHPYTCKALFRYFPPLARQFILQIIFSNGAVPMKRISSNTKQRDTANEAIKVLLKYQIIEVKTMGQQQMVQMNPTFQRTFLSCLTNGQEEYQRRNGSEGGVGGDGESKPMKPDKKPPSVSFLENFARSQWESVLQYLNTSSSSSDISFQFSTGIQQLLEWSHLVRGDGDGSSGGSGGGSGSGGHSDESSTKSRITKEGFQFLLLDNRTQVWKLLRQYIDTAEKRSMLRNEILQFLFELSFMHCGRGYMVKPLTGTQRVMLLDLAELGLVYRRKPKAKWFYPTTLAIGMTGIHNAIAPSDPHSSVNTTTTTTTSATTTNSTTMSATSDQSVSSLTGHIIVETNFRVYAYTSSPLQISLLCLFAIPEYRLPNLVVGMITRESVREALIHGITADQILSYLTIHAHPHMKRNKQVLPETVADQVRLWEKERNRIQLINAVHYDKFPSLDKFRMVQEYAKKIGVYLWSSEDKMKLIIQRDGHEKLVAFIKQNVR